MDKDMGNNELITPRVIEHKYSEQYNMLLDSHKSFILWFNKEVSKYKTIFDKLNSKKLFKQHCEDEEHYITDLKNHVITINYTDIPYEFDNILYDCAYRIISPFSIGRADDSEELYDFLHINYWKILRFYSSDGSVEDKYYRFHWIDSSTYICDNLYYDNQYKKANEELESNMLINGKSFDIYNKSDYDDFIKFFNNYVENELSSKDNIKDRVDGIIKLDSYEVPDKFCYSHYSDSFSSTSRRIYLPYLDYLKLHGWDVQYAPLDESYYNLCYKVRNGYHV